MAQKEKMRVRVMTVEQTTGCSFLNFLDHLVKLEDLGRDEPRDLLSSMRCPETQDTSQKEMRGDDDPTDPTSREPGPIICAWPRPYLEEVLARLRGNGSTDLNPQQQKSSPPRAPPLPPQSQPRANFQRQENSSSNSGDIFVNTIGRSLVERDSTSDGREDSRAEDSSEEGGEHSMEEDSSEEGDDCRDEDYIPTDGCKYQNPFIAQIACRRSLRKRMTEAVYSPASPEPLPEPLLDSSKRTRSNALVFKRSRFEPREEWSVVPIDEEQTAAQIPVAISHGSLTRAGTGAGVLEPAEAGSSSRILSRSSS